MKIFADEFINWIKKNTICRLKGHKASDWTQEHWAIAHATGFEIKYCLRCNIELARHEANCITQYIDASKREVSNERTSI